MGNLEPNFNCKMLVSSSQSPLTLSKQDKWRKESQLPTPDNSPKLPYRAIPGWNPNEKLELNYLGSTQEENWLFSREELAKLRSQKFEEPFSIFQWWRQYGLKQTLAGIHDWQEFGRIGSGGNTLVSLQIFSTAQVYLKRHYLIRPPISEEVVLIMGGALLLASKVEDHGYPPQDILQFINQIWSNFNVGLDGLIHAEMSLVMSLDANLIVHHPFVHLDELRKGFGFNDRETELSIALLMDHYATDLPLLHNPMDIAFSVAILTLKSIETMQVMSSVLKFHQCISASARKLLRSRFRFDSKEKGGKKRKEMIAAENVKYLQSINDSDDSSSSKDSCLENENVRASKSSIVSKNERSKSLNPDFSKRSMISIWPSAMMTECAPKYQGTYYHIGPVSETSKSERESVKYWVDSSISAAEMKERLNSLIDLAIDFCEVTKLADITFEFWGLYGEAVAALEKLGPDHQVVKK